MLSLDIRKSLKGITSGFTVATEEYYCNIRLTLLNQLLLLKVLIFPNSSEGTSSSVGSVLRHVLYFSHMFLTNHSFVLLCHPCPFLTLNMKLLVILATKVP